MSERILVFLSKSLFSVSSCNIFVLAITSSCFRRVTSALCADLEFGALEIFFLVVSDGCAEKEGASGFKDIRGVLDEVDSVTEVDGVAVLCNSEPDC